MSIFLERISNFMSGPSFTLLFFLLIIWVVGMLFKRIGLPIMLGEMLAGLILGPPLLNIIQADIHIEWLADLGIFFLMFFTGMEVDLNKLTKQLKNALLIAFGGTIGPFILGYFITTYFGGSVIQGLFIGMAISVTSIATKARILHELGLLKKKVGTVMVSAALYDNIFSMILFAVIVSIAKIGKVDFGSLTITLLGIIVFFSVTVPFGYYMFPKLKTFFSHKGGSGFTFSLMVALIFGFFAEVVGLHFIIGVFMAGIFVRDEIMESTDLYKKLFDTMYVISYGFLGPIFFLTLSFHVDLNILFTVDFLFLVILTIGAIVGKVFGAALFAKLTGFSNRDSLIIGLGMNGRGMVEIVLVVIGMELGILSDNYVSILVFMAMATTLITPLGLKLIAKKKE